MIPSSHQATIKIFKGTDKYIVFCATKPIEQIDRLMNGRMYPLTLEGIVQAAKALT
ncbi:hypothetical protein N482_07295 [Pseudoalteromonas luteoviolacea NCIMB 1942]|uniref:Uncharacterized protein n=1 Tax=Pseudoalteromonas luteoviolacea NCIMB 1942 TaxID=1365253 RepID=A0A167DB66_9GAMM|nr:hypothetical protein N482_07295 [Pseudoalteromonas luteoviolacea NCIMB 1942]